MIRNRYFDKKIPSKSSLSGHSDIAIIYFKFLTSQEMDSENSSVECKQDIKKLLESKNVYVDDSPNDDLESEFWKDSLRCSKEVVKRLKFNLDNLKIVS